MTNRPILAVSTCIWRDDHVLMIKRGQNPSKGLWSLPGGRVEFGEKLIDAARRELHEETGIEAGVLSLVDFSEVISALDTHYVLAVFTGIWHAGTAKAASDAAEADWLMPSDIARLSATPGLETMVEKAAQLITLDR